MTERPMKALTISQPYASLIADGEKFVENRTWECLYRGPLMIHAGKGTQYLTKGQLADYPSGCVVAVCEMLGAVHVPTLRESAARGISCGRFLAQQCRRIAAHEHTEGPFGFILGNVRKLAAPVPAKGAQGLWTPSDELIRDVMCELPDDSTFKRIDKGE